MTRTKFALSANSANFLSDKRIKYLIIKKKIERSLWLLWIYIRSERVCFNDGSRATR